MSAQLFFDPQTRPLTNAGVTMPLATLTFYLASSTTPANVYADADLQSSLGNVLTADSDGRFTPFYLDGSITYRVILEDASAVEIYDVDPYYPPRDYQPGTVVMWFGAAIDLETYYPSALWQICDGTNSSPDMGGRAPMGVGGGFAVGDESGAATDNITTSAESSHTHAGGTTGSTVLDITQIPAHYHQTKGNYVSGGYDGGGNQFYRARTSDSVQNAAGDFMANAGGGLGHDHSGGTTGAGSAHSHTATVDTRGPMTALYMLMRKYP